MKKLIVYFFLFAFFLPNTQVFTAKISGKTEDLTQYYFKNIYFRTSHYSVASETSSAFVTPNGSFTHQIVLPDSINTVTCYGLFM